MSSLTLNGDTSGSILIQAPAVAGSGTLTLPTGTATLGIQGPAFSGYKTVNQSFSQNTWTKVTFPSEEFDTASCFDTSNSRFTPNIAGYYQLNVVCPMIGSATDIYSQLYKNGSGMNPAHYSQMSLTTSGIFMTFSSLIYLNGSTDYLELYAYSNGASPSIGYSGANFQGFFVRGA